MLLISTFPQLRVLWPLIDEVLIRLCTYINREISSKQPFDAREICAKYTTDVVSSCIFNADAESFTKDNPKIREMGRKLMDFTSNTSLMIKFMLLAAFPFLQGIVKLQFVPKDAQEFFTDLMQQAIKLRQSTQINRDDYLAFLIDLQKKKNLSNLDMAAHSITFFVDGFETSSVAISNALYEIANDKRVQDKLRKQINEELIDANGKIIYEKMLEHEYLNQVFFEALRLHPPATITIRECTEEITLEGNHGERFKVEKGMSLSIPMYSIHRNPGDVKNY
jgi:cytochrome P450 family 6/cytochrome P450 family 28